MRNLQGTTVKINDNKKLRAGIKYIHIGLCLLIIGVFLLGIGVLGAISGLPLSALIP